MSEYSNFIPEEHEILCPACGSILNEEKHVESGWICSCGDFIPESMVISSFRGLSCKHKQNSDWR